MKIDHDNATVTLRQSWMDTFSTCPERARRAIVQPEYESESDEAWIGTATHYGIESFLRGEGEADEIAYDFAMTKKASDLNMTKRKSMKEIADLAYDLAGSWEREIYPHIPRGGKAEATFKVPLFKYMGYDILLSGTADYVVEGEVWDWKTSGRAYVAWEKQRYAIQPTAYLSVLERGLLPGSGKHPFPLTFKYGVMMKPGTWVKGGSKDARQGVQTDIITVRRDQSDVDWMHRRIKQMVRLGLTDLDEEWPMIDESGLCSAKWCPWWSSCKGAHIDEAVNNPTPRQ